MENMSKIGIQIEQTCNSWQQWVMGSAGHHFACHPHHPQKHQNNVEPHDCTTEIPIANWCAPTELQWQISCMSLIIQTVYSYSKYALICCLLPQICPRIFELQLTTNFGTETAYLRTSLVSASYAPTFYRIMSCHRQLQWNIQGAFPEHVPPCSFHHHNKRFPLQSCSAVACASICENTRRGIENLLL